MDTKQDKFIARILLVVVNALASLVKRTPRGFWKNLFLPLLRLLARELNKLKR